MGDQPNHMPEICVSFASNGDVVDPHVEVGPIDHDEKSCAPQTGLTSSLRDDESNAESDFNDAGHVDPKGCITKNFGDNGLKPDRVGEVLNAYIDVQAAEYNGCQEQRIILD